MFAGSILGAAGRQHLAVVCHYNVQMVVSAGKKGIVCCLGFVDFI